MLLVNDVSNPMAAAQSDAVEAVLRDLEIDDIPLIRVWNKVRGGGVCLFFVLVLLASKLAGKRNI